MQSDMANDNTTSTLNENSQMQADLHTCMQFIILSASATSPLLFIDDYTAFRHVDRCRGTDPGGNFHREDRHHKEVARGSGGGD